MILDCVVFGLLLVYCWLVNWWIVVCSLGICVCVVCLVCICCWVCWWLLWCWLCNIGVELCVVWYGLCWDVCVVGWGLVWCIVYVLGWWW